MLNYRFPSKVYFSFLLTKEIYNLDASLILMVLLFSEAVPSPEISRSEPYKYFNSGDACFSILNLSKSGLRLL